MKWTTARPTVEGHYWMEAETLSGQIKRFIVHVYPSNYDWYVFWDGENFHLNADCFLRWSDTPIPEPT